LPATAPQEAWRVEVDKTAGGLEAGIAPGGPQYAKTATYTVSVFDWQHGHYADVVGDYPRAGFNVGLARESDIATVKVAIPALVTGDLNLPVSLPAPEDAPAYGAPQLLAFTIDNSVNEQPEGTYWGLVEVTDERIPEPDLTTIGDDTATFGIDASTLEFRTLPAFKTYQLFQVEVGEGNLAPTARATATSTTSVPQGGTVSFDATTSSDPNGDPLTYIWDFNGDGTFGDPVKDNFTGSPSTPVHTFLAPGLVQVNLKVDDGRSGSDTLDAAGAAPLIRIPVTISPVNIPPVACATVTSDITYIQTGAVVTFDCTCSFDTSSPLVYEWDFDGDGNFGDAWDVGSPTPPFTVYHTYPTRGTYNVKVRVRETATPQMYQDDSDPITVVVHQPALLINNPTGGSPRYFGHTMALGDLNKDGLDDLVVSATGFHTAPTEETTGAVYIYFNQNTTPTFGATPDVRITAIAAGGWNNKGAYGFDLDIGDMNGDTWPDIAVGMNGFTGAVLEGRCEWIVNRGAAGAPSYFTNAASIPTGLQRPTTAIQVGNPTPGGPEQFGTSLDVADLDQDGKDDIVVGAIQGDRPNGHEQAGECYAFRSNGLAVQLIATLDKNPYYSAEFLGCGITAGDYDGDGDCDVIGGGISIKTSGISNAGALCYWKNHQGEAGYTAPFTFGGVAPYYGVDQIYLGTLVTPVGDSNLGFMLRSADLDGDGYEELVAAAPGHTAGNRPVKCGAVFVYRGSNAWKTGFPLYDQTLFSATPEAGGYFGHAISLGDVDGDGDIDLVSSSPYHDTSSTLRDTGLAEVFKWTGTAFNPVGTVLREPWTNTNLAEAGFGLAIGHIDSTLPGRGVAIGATRGPSTTGAGRVTITYGPY
ncbi:MAG: FG-GAP-like repeat-containing protein, partial [bacterium]